MPYSVAIIGPVPEQDLIQLSETARIEEIDLIPVLTPEEICNTTPLGYISYVPNAPDLHVLFGWLQIESRLAVDTASALPKWLRYHPHVHNRGAYSQNALYVSSSRLQLRSRPFPLPGAGVFPRFAPALQLTAPTASSRSLWELPRWLHPVGRASTLSYHGKPSRWQLGDRSVLLRNVGQGQEFVLDCEHYPEAVDWLATLLTQANPPVACA